MADAPLPSESAPAEPALSRTQSTLGRSWTLKRYAFIAVLLGIGVWATLDAFWLYPARGLRAADREEYRFLDGLKQARGGILDAGSAGYTDPASKFAALSEQVKQRQALAGIEEPVFKWFEQLYFLGRLKPEYTAYPRKVSGGADVATPEERFTQLREVWTTKEGKAKDASPLTAYDLPLQYLFMALFIPWGFYLLFDYLKAKRSVYRWDNAQQRLTLPGGASLVPADLAEVDKRKWDKFYVTLKVKDTHPQLGGQGVELDLMRFDPIEAWVLAMEQTAFPENAAPADAAPDSNPPASPSTPA